MLRRSPLRAEFFLPPWVNHWAAISLSRAEPRLLRYFPLQAKALRASGRSPSGGRQRGIVAGRASIGVVARIDDTVHVGRVYVCHRARWPVGAARVIKGVEARRLRLSPFTLTRCPRLRLLLANAGNDKRAIKDWLGHRSTQHAVDYTELTPTRFKTFWSACRRARLTAGPRCRRD
jgi:hypothetical protein